MHKNGVCHRDLKPDNIIVDSSNNIKLIDFNVFASFDYSEEEPYPKTICGGTGLKEWSAPETRTESFYSAKSDIWSVGCIFHNMLTGVSISNEFSYDKIKI